MNAVTVVVSSVGAVLELAGILLAFDEVRRRARQLTEFRSSMRNVTVYAEPAIAHAEAYAAAVVISGQEPPTLDQRVDELDRRLSEDVPRQVRKARDTAVERANAALRPVIDNVRREASDDIEKVRDLLVRSLAGNNRAYASLGLIVIGLFAQTTGTILSSLAG